MTSGLAVVCPEQSATPPLPPLLVVLRLPQPRGNAMPNPPALVGSSGDFCSSVDGP